MTAAPEDVSALRRLKTRSQFLRAARGKRAGRPSFALQAVENGAADAAVGFTVTKKVGNAVVRNRVKRRLRAAVTVCARDFVPGRDYVLVGRREALSEPFDTLVGNLSRALASVNAATPHSRPAGHRNSRA
jgi:ribonuclease P protein component